MFKSKLSKNLIITFCTYAFILVANIFVSNIVLRAYGSEINGLLSSVNQIFSYVALLEAGIGTATTTALYKPLEEKNYQLASEIYSASVTYYRKVLKWYLACVFVISFVFPCLLDTEIDYWTIFAIISIQGVSNALTFYFVSATTNYLLATGKNYVNMYIHVIITCLTYVAKVIIALLGRNIVLITVWLLIINFIKCTFYWLYKKFKCKEIEIIKTKDTSLLKQRNSFLIHEISGCIFGATDLIIISIFCDLKMASVYSVYSLVTVAISSIIGQVFSSCSYILGSAFANKENYNNTHDKFNTVYIASVFCLYTVAYLLLLPFVKLYTSGITDINYTDEFLPILFVGIQLLSSCRIVDNALIKNSLHAKQTVSRTIIESGINLVLSIILVQFIGIYGVLLGTIIALLYRSNDMIIYANKCILKRLPWKEYRLYFINWIVFAIFVLLSHYEPISISSYVEFLLKGICVFAIVAVSYFLINIINAKLDKNCLK